VFPPIPPGAYTGEILLNIQAYPAVLARLFEALVLLVAYRADPSLRARTIKQGTVQSSAVASVLAGVQLTRILVGALTHFPLEVVGALTRERLVVEVARASASVLTRIVGTTEIDGKLALLPRHMWVTLTGCRIGDAFAVGSTRLACFFAEINCFMTGDAPPALVAVTFRGFPSLCRRTESISTASHTNAWVTGDFSFTKCTSVASRARTDKPTIIGSIVALAAILTLDVVTREKGLGVALAAVVAIVTRVTVANSVQAVATTRTLVDAVVPLYMHVCNYSTYA
jgi:hypothetical protein